MLAISISKSQRIFKNDFSPRNCELPASWSHTSTFPPPFRGNSTIDRENLYFKDGRYTTLYRITKDATIGLEYNYKSEGWMVDEDIKPEDL
jgi:hypothetical protein